MNNEIKEILDFKENADYKRLSCDEIAILRDYITNLQEKLEVTQDNEESYRLEMQDITKCLGLDEHTLFDDVKYYATNLQQKIKHYEETTTFGDYVKEVNLLVDYKSRIEKAVEYISSNCILSREWEEVEFCKFLAIETITYKALSRGKIKELLNILNGRSDE